MATIRRRRRYVVAAQPERVSLAGVALLACWRMHRHRVLDGRRSALQDHRRRDPRVADGRRRLRPTTAAGLSRISCGSATLPTSWSSVAVRHPVDLGPRAGRGSGPARHDDRRDQRRRLAGVANRRALLVEMFTDVERAPSAPLSRGIRRPRPLQGRQRPTAAIGDVVLRGVARRSRQPPPRLGRVTAARSSCSPHARLTSRGASSPRTRVVARSGSQSRATPSCRSDPDRDRRRRSPARRRAARSCATPTRRVLGEVARPQPDVGLRRARRGCTDSSRRRIGRPVRAAPSRLAWSPVCATARLTAVVSPLPH